MKLAWQAYPSRARHHGLAGAEQMGAGTTDQN